LFGRIRHAWERNTRPRPVSGEQVLIRAETNREITKKVHARFLPEFQERMSRRIRLRGSFGHILFYEITGEEGKRKVMAVKHPRWWRRKTSVVKELMALTVLRRVPGLRNHVPQAWLIKEGGKRLIALSDLTRRGKYIVKSPLQCRNKKEMLEEIGRLQRIMEENGWVDSTADPFLAQVDPKTGRGIKVWIADASNTDFIGTQP
jgi:hypothetical protein